MITMYSVLSLAHLVGLALGVGSATIKLALLTKCKTDSGFIAVYLKVARPITCQIILGLILLTLSGIGLLFIGYPFTVLLGVKLVLVVAIWVLGPLIDKVVEPEFRKLAPTSGQPASPAFLRIQKRYLAMEASATLLFYLSLVIGVFV